MPLLAILTLLSMGCQPQAPAFPYSKSLLVDVRSPEEFREGTVEGAINIPLDELPDRLAEISKDLPVVLFCRSGNRSEEAILILRKSGYTKLINGGSWLDVSEVLTFENKKK